MSPFGKQLLKSLCEMILQIRRSPVYSEQEFKEFLMKMNLDFLWKITAIYYLGNPYQTFEEAMQDISERSYDFTMEDCIRKITDVAIDTLEDCYHSGFALL